MRVATFVLAICLPSLLGPSVAMAQTAAPAAPAAQSAAPAPAKAGSAKMDKAAISKECSQQADAQHLHGKSRKEFRSKCKQHGGTPARLRFGASSPPAPSRPAAHLAAGAIRPEPCEGGH